jgi:hypothetical protein
MISRHTWVHEDNYTNQLNGTSNRTTITKDFEAETLDDVVSEFRNYLWNCGYTYVEEVKVVTKSEL